MTNQEIYDRISELCKYGSQYGLTKDEDIELSRLIAAERETIRQGTNELFNKDKKL